MSNTVNAVDVVIQEVYDDTLAALDAVLTKHKDTEGGDFSLYATIKIAAHAMEVEMGIKPLEVTTDAE